MSADQNAGKNRNIKIGNKSFERVEQFWYLERTQTNQDPIHEEIKSGLKSGNAIIRCTIFCPPVCYRIHNPLTSRVLRQQRRVVVGIVTGYGLDGPGIESRWGRDFPHLSKQALWAVRRLQSLSACTRVHFTFYLTLRRVFRLPMPAEWKIVLSVTEYNKCRISAPQARKPT